MNSIKLLTWPKEIKTSPLLPTVILPRVALIILMLTAVALVFPATATAINLTNKNIIQKLLVDEANRQGLDPTLALAIAEVESNFDPHALSKVGAMGVMQIMPATAANVFGIAAKDLYDANINIPLGIRFIKDLLIRYEQRLDIALSHYNGGSAVQDEFGRLTVIPATKKYVNKVLAAQEKFKYKAYQLSSISSEQTMEHENTLPQQKLVNNQFNHNMSTNEQSALPLVKEVTKPDKLYSAISFEQSLYKKVEQLRALRLHNIMRNTQSKTPQSKSPQDSSAKKNQLRKVSFRHNGLAIAGKVQKLNVSSIPLSDKRKKVLAWEKIFN